jgi:hypothetical protein
LKCPQQAQAVSLVLNQGALVRADYHLFPLLQPDTGDYTTAFILLPLIVEIMVVEIDSRRFVSDKYTLLQPLLQGSCGTSISIVCSRILR